MAFAWIFESNFEQGDSSDWDSETDSANQLDFPHYSELAQYPDSLHTPYSGAYCMRLQLTGGTADAIVLEADINIGNAVTTAFSFDIQFSKNFASSSGTDVVHLLELTGSGTAVTGVIGFDVAVTAADGTLGTIRMGIGDNGTSGAVADTFASTPIERGQWYTIENVITLNTGGTGTSNLFITKAGDPAQLTADIARTSRDMIVVTDGEFGLQAHDATTTGTILLDNFIQDDLRVFPRERHPLAPLFTKSGHAFVGRGWINSAALLTDETTNIMRLWDTDIADVSATQSFKLEFDVDGTAGSFDGPVYFQHGCFVELSGTDPRGQVFLADVSGHPGIVGPTYYKSDALVRRLGLARKGPAP